MTQPYTGTLARESRSPTFAKREFMILDQGWARHSASLSVTDRPKDGS